MADTAGDRSLAGEAAGPAPATGAPNPAAHRRAAPSLAGLVAVGLWWCAIICIALAVRYRIPVRQADLAGLGALGVTDLIDLAITAVAVTFGALVVVRGSSSRYGWLLLALGAVNAAGLASAEFALHGWYVAGARDSVLVAAATWLQLTLTMVVLGLMVVALPALFPDGRPVGRWRRPFRVVAVLWVAWMICFAFATRGAENVFLDLPDAPDNPVGLLPPAFTAPLKAVWVLLMLSGVVISIGSLRTRWRTATGEARQQLKWVLYALGVAGGVALLSAFEYPIVVTLLGHDEEPITSLGLPLAWVGVMVAIGLALLRFRLYDVDLVINRTVVYAAISVVLLTLYALVVASAATLLPGAGETWASLAAAGVVALVFAPLREEVQRRVDRLMFGRRSDPVGVLADVGSTVATSDAPDSALHAIAASVVTALKLPGASIEISGEHGAAPATVTAGELGSGQESFPLRYQGHLVGRLVAARRSPAEALSAADRHVLGNVAHLAAPVARTVELNRALQRSRDRLVRAREEERRRLRRDLHDGLGPSLASQTFRIDAALALCETQPAAASEHLRALKAQTRELVADIRRLVYELRPPALDELGLGGAVAAYAGQYADAALRVRTATTPDPLGALPAAVEVASYRIITEAITNAARHAQATACSVEIANSGRTLTIVIADDGVGLPPGVAPGVGLTSMRERAAELGGTLTVASRLGGGTRVEAILPTDPADTSAVLDHAPARGTDGLAVPQGADDVEAATGAQDPAEDLDPARATDDARA